MDEVDYYPEIKKYFIDELTYKFPNFLFWGGIKNIETTIQKEIPDKFTVLRETLLSKIIPVETDIDMICYNPKNGKYLVIILEIKVNPLNLMNLSQLSGYLNVTGCFLGLLITVDSNLSSRFLEIIKSKPKLLDYIVIQEKKRNIKIGLAIWRHKPQDISFKPFGSIQTIDALFEIIEKKLS
ncbi:MAG: hypothetical protein ACTSPD_21440 [Promethearchaeota archaeon]